jgi:hypothetical protein
MGKFHSIVTVQLKIGKMHSSGYFDVIKIGVMQTR